MGIAVGQQVIALHRHGPLLARLLVNLDQQMDLTGGLVPIGAGGGCGDHRNVFPQRGHRVK